MIEISISFFNFLFNNLSYFFNYANIYLSVNFFLLNTILIPIIFFNFCYYYFYLCIMHSHIIYLIFHLTYICKLRELS